MSASAATPGLKAPTPEDLLRAGIYSLLAGLLRQAPDAAMLARLDGIEDVEVSTENPDSNSDTDELGQAWAGLKQAAQTADVIALDEEYNDLFIGVGRGELVPHGSWYLTGFLNEKPLADLRRDLAELGYERQDDVHEPEDHVAALCEVMAMLITDESASFGCQRTFFETHIGVWMAKFFADLETAKTASFYRAVARLGAEFIQLEQRYLSMQV